MPASRVQTVAAILDAFNLMDAEECVSHLSEDVYLRPSAFITGRGEYRGREDVLNGFAEMIEDLEERRERVRVKPLHHYAEEGDEDRILSLCRVTITRESGDEFGTDIAYLWTFDGDRVVELNAWLDHAEGLSQLESPVEVSG